MGSSQYSNFRLTGKFLGYELKGYKIQYINLSNDLGQYRLKLSSDARDDLLRAALQGNLQVGDWMEVLGYQKRKDNGEVKLKVQTVLRTTEPSTEADSISVPPTHFGPRTQILVCGKSNCCKRGAMAVQEKMEQEVETNALGERVQVIKTGCLKDCGKGPNLLVGETRYNHVKPADVPEILNHHFPVAQQSLGCISMYKESCEVTAAL